MNKREQIAKIACDELRCNWNTHQKCEWCKEEELCPAALSHADKVLSLLSEGEPEELTDEELNQAWKDCYGEPLLEEHGLLFGRTVKGRQVDKLKPYYAAREAKLEAEIERLKANKRVKHYQKNNTTIKSIEPNFGAGGDMWA